jgi:hypothetical protein
MRGKKIMEGRRGWKNAAAIALFVLLAGCTSSKSGGDSGLTSADNVTNAPVAGGVNTAPGSEEDFMVSVGRRTFFKQSSASSTMWRARPSTSRRSGSTSIRNGK